MTRTLLLYSCFVCINVGSLAFTIWPPVPTSTRDFKEDEFNSVNEVNDNDDEFNSVNEVNNNDDEFNSVNEAVLDPELSELLQHIGGETSNDDDNTQTAPFVELGIRSTPFNLKLRGPDSSFRDDAVDEDSFQPESKRSNFRKQLNGFGEGSPRRKHHSKRIHRREPNRHRYIPSSIIDFSEESDTQPQTPRDLQRSNLHPKLFTKISITSYSYYYDGLPDTKKSSDPTPSIDQSTESNNKPLDDHEDSAESKAQLTTSSDKSEKPFDSVHETSNDRNPSTELNDQPKLSSDKSEKPFHTVQETLNDRNLSTESNDQPKPSSDKSEEPFDIDHKTSNDLNPFTELNDQPKPSSDKSEKPLDAFQEISNDRNLSTESNDQPKLPEKASDQYKQSSDAPHKTSSDNETKPDAAFTTSEHRDQPAKLETEQKTVATQ